MTKISEISKEELREHIKEDDMNFRKVIALMEEALRDDNNLLKRIGV